LLIVGSLEVDIPFWIIEAGQCGSVETFYFSLIFFLTVDRNLEHVEKWAASCVILNRRVSVDFGFLFCELLDAKMCLVGRSAGTVSHEFFVLGYLGALLSLVLLR
jgi:hypothetical protein